MDASEHGAAVSFAQSLKPIKSQADINREIANARKARTTSKPIAHYSFTITKHQSRWSSTDFELNGLYLSLRKLQFLLENKSIFVSTDNAGVASYFKLAANSRQLKLVSFLQSFHLKVYHIAGKLNASADILSRLNSLLASAEKVELELNDHLLLPGSDLDFRKI